jgi:DNA-binding protein H-NS
MSEESWMSPQVDDVLAALDGMSVGELRQVVSSAEAKIRDKAENEKRTLREEVERRAGELGVSVHDLFGEPAQPAAKRGRKPGAKKADGDGPAPKYQGPNGELWSGRGRMPRWLQAAQAGGRAKDDFLIGR